MASNKSNSWPVLFLGAATLGGWGMYLYEKNTHQATTVQFESTLKEQQQQLDSVADKHVQLEQDSSGLQAEIEKLQSERDGLKEELAVLTPQRAELESEHESLSNRLADAQFERERVAAENQEFGSRLQVLEKENARLEQELNALTEVQSTSPGDQSVSDSASDASQEALTQISAERDKLQADFDQLSNRLADAQFERERVAAENQEFGSRLQVLEKENARLEQELNALTEVQSTSPGDQSVSDSASDASQEALTQISAERDKLQADFDQLSNRLADAQFERERVAAENQELSSRLSVVEREKERLEQELAATMLEFDQIRSSHTDLNNLHSELKTSLDQAIAEKEHLAGQGDQINADLVRTKDEHARLARERDSLAKIRELLGSDLEKTREERDHAHAQFEELKNSLESELQSKSVELEQLKNENTIIRVAGDILFRPGSSTLSDPGREALGHIATALRAYPENLISLEGHTDNVPISQNLRDRFASNWELSVARAVSAARYLQSQGIEPQRLRAVGYGEFHPVADNSDSEARAHNRRLEIRLLPASEIEIEQELSSAQ